MDTLSRMRAFLLAGLAMAACSGPNDAAESFSCPDGATGPDPCAQAIGGDTSTGGTQAATGGAKPTGGATSLPPDAGSTGGVAGGGQASTGGAPVCGSAELYCSGACRQCPAAYPMNADSVHAACSGDTCIFECNAGLHPWAQSLSNCSTQTTPNCCTGYIAGTLTIATRCGCN